MSFYLIPTLEGVPDYTMRSRFDGRDFNLHFLWNQRTERWSMDILDADGVPLAMGIIIITNRPLTRFYLWNPAMPQGELVAWDLSNDYGDPPGFNEMAPGRRVELTYQSSLVF
jgi:hypothetical protein